MRALYFVYHVSRRRLEAVVEDRKGARRRIVLSWRDNLDNTRLPGDWLAAIRGEVEYQMAEDLRKRKGGVWEG